MNHITILCEGVTDQLFLADCLELFFGVKVTRVKQKKSMEKLDVMFGQDCRIIEIGGCGKITNNIILDLLSDNSKLGGKNIVLFDADFGERGRDGKKSTGNNGYKSAKQKLIDIQVQHKVEYDFYLWHNDNDDGEIEDLLCQLVPNEKRPLFNCFNSFNQCIKECGISNLRVPELKEHLNSYLYLSCQDTKNRDYKDQDYWNLDLSKCNDLLKLKSFLEKSLGLKHYEESSVSSELQFISQNDM